MSTQSEQPSPRSDSSEHRRWLIGIGISLLFGIFGSVMAFLSYSAKTRSVAPAPAKVTGAQGAAPEPAEHGRRKDRHR